MENIYGVAKNNQKDYERYLNASKYTIDDITEVGSGSNCNTIVSVVRAEDLWPVSRFGGLLQDIPLELIDYGGWDTFDLINRQERNEEQVLTTKDKLEEVRDIFGLSISHLAKVLCVSRPSLHSWLENIEPTRERYIDRIDEIYQYAMTWNSLSPYHYSPARLMRQPLGNGPSMLQRFELETLNDIEIHDGFAKLLQLMQRQREQMDRAKSRTKDSSRPAEEKALTRHGLTNTISSSK